MFTLIKFLILILVLIVCVYAFYCFIIAFTSRNRCRFVRHGKYSVANYYNNLVVIIYAHNNEDTIVPLLEALNKQNYPKENYKTYIILDNCTDNSANLLEMVGGANLYRVGDSFDMGKDESITQLLDRLLNVKSINAYVFLGANRSIDENFLGSINQGLLNHDVLVGNTILKGEPKTLKQKIISAYNKYENNIINTSRSMLGLSSIINSDCCVIKQNVIERVQCIDFRDLNSEFKYSLTLAKFNFKVSYEPNIVSCLDYDNFKIRKPSFSYRISLLKNSLSLFFDSNFKFCEFALSAIQPSIIALVGFMIFFGWMVSILEFNDMPFKLFFNSKMFFILIAVFVVSALYSFFNSKLSFKEFGFLALYPLYSLAGLIRKMPVIKQICDLTSKINKKEKNESYSIPVIVAAGEKKMKCQIDLIQENGMIRAVFSFKKKKHSTDLYLRVYDAIKSISDLLAERDYEIVDPDTKKVVNKVNFDLQICQNCKYFTTRLDGTNNLIKGNCSLRGETPQSSNLVMLWQCCEQYVPNREKIVDLSQYRK